MKFINETDKLLASISALLLCVIGCGHEPVGVELTYEIDTSTAGEVGAGGMQEVIRAIQHRVNGRGEVRAANEKHVLVRLYGNPLKTVLNSTKLLIRSMGGLEFRLAADNDHAEDKPIIEKAKQLATDEKIVTLGDKRVAEWVAYSEAEFGPVDKARHIVTRMAGKVPESLLLTDKLNVSGAYLTSVTKGLDDRGNTAIYFSLDAKGARLFRQLTSENLPNTETGAYRLLGIVLDKKLLSAPRIQEVISDRGLISGRTLTERDIDNIINILNAGSLPYPVKLLKEVRVWKPETK
jgi:SecD/SecF fusion protein